MVDLESPANELQFDLKAPISSLLPPVLIGELPAIP